ncbi:SDR family NAD(P)-dependent oxidoreductase [Streptomonospora sp. S1-112]|uniref:SDR family NAD(P)-dependent oxidoreductase n=1 Tax=Streptomonospora mangrovi TaxID=2883123 RepID=A0A9X3SE39_9ACTN|nr:SDR family NAD(P)-dependent oxidoreductase [Streptomonospora mangrovi]MDA0563370.1 SDR family NAD(P)-dependent oxidoreductase [Streptomonospora mangrovi]
MLIDSATVAVVTGGSQGIGLGIARALARRGAALALLDIDPAAMEAAAAELSPMTRVATRRVDVRDRAAMAAAADGIGADLGAVNLVVANAGVGLGVFQPLDRELRYSTWDYVVGVNLEGVNNTVQTFLPAMLERGAPGHVVTTASAAGLAVFPERSSGYTYHASKFAVVGLTEALRRGLADLGSPVSASVLIPGLVATQVAANSVRHAPAASVDPGDRERIGEMVAAGTAAAAALGRDPDAVGEQTLAAIEADALYIPTDRLAESAVRDRAAAVIAAMPPASAYDGGLAAAMESRRSGGGGGRPARP